MARGKYAHKEPAPPKEPAKKHAEPYFCTLCNHHHGRRTKVALSHIQYRRDK